jgi:hypothetical protein
VVEKCFFGDAVMAKLKRMNPINPVIVVGLLLMMSMSTSNLAAQQNYVCKPKDKNRPSAASDCVNQKSTPVAGRVKEPIDPRRKPPRPPKQVSPVKDELPERREDDF